MATLFSSSAIRPQDALPKITHSELVGVLQLSQTLQPGATAVAAALARLRSHSISLEQVLIEREVLGPICHFGHLSDLVECSIASALLTSKLGHPEAEFYRAQYLAWRYGPPRACSFEDFLSRSTAIPAIRKQHRSSL